MNHRIPAGLFVPLLAMSLNASAQPLACEVRGGDDLFILYPHQQIWQSPDYRVFALMNGLTLAVVNRQTLKFNRLTSLNLTQPADRMQFFEGQCRTMQPQRPEQGNIDEVNKKPPTKA